MEFEWLLRAHVRSYAPKPAIQEDVRCRLHAAHSAGWVMPMWCVCAIVGRTMCCRMRQLAVPTLQCCAAAVATQ